MRPTSYLELGVVVVDHGLGNTDIHDRRVSEMLHVKWARRNPQMRQNLEPRIDLYLQVIVLIRTGVVSTKLRWDRSRS